MDVKEEILKILARHLALDAYRVFLYGSRATNQAKKWSDYDIGLQGKKPVSLQILAKIDEDLENSDIPYKVDVTDFQRTNQKFRSLALTNVKQWTI